MKLLLLLVILAACTMQTEVQDAAEPTDADVPELTTDEEILQEYPDGLDKALEELDLLET